MPDLNKAYQWAVQTCGAPNVGYSQPYRNQKTVNGITYYDCSSFINYALLAGGWSTPQYAPNNNPLTTLSMYTVLPTLGFSQVDPNGLILPGDIGLSDDRVDLNPSGSQHTEMCYAQGVGSAIFMGAHGRSNRSLQDQVSIGDFGDPTYTRSFASIWRYGSGGATGYGISLTVISALCGNAWKESQINPGLEEVGGGGGWGIFQWTGSRRTAFETWCTQNGYSFDDPYGQLQYLIYENFWQPTSPYPFNTLDEFLASTSTDLEMLVRAWEDCWEISGDDESQIQQRIAWAQQCMAYITAHANDTSIISWYSSSGYIPESQTLNNAVMLYRYLSAGGGGGGTFTKEKGMPLWMKIRYHY